MSAGYDDSCITLSQEGRIYQIEYALKAVENACTVTGLVCSDGIILASEKLKNNKTQISNSNPTIYSITKTIGIAICGYLPDGRNLVARAKEEARSYLDNFGIEISGKILAERIASYVHFHTLYWFYRPFGSVALISSFDKDGAHLYMVENSGNFFEYYACSHGKGRQYVKNDVEKNNFAIREKTCSSAVKDVLKSLIKSYEGERDTEYDISIISTETKGRHTLVNKDAITQLVKTTKEEVSVERQMEVDG